MRTVTIAQNDPHLPFRLRALNVPESTIEEMMKPFDGETYHFVPYYPIQAFRDERMPEEIGEIIITTGVNSQNGNLK